MRLDSEIQQIKEDIEQNTVEVEEVAQALALTDGLIPPIEAEVAELQEQLSNVRGRPFPPSRSPVEPTVRSRRVFRGVRCPTLRWCVVCVCAQRFLPVCPRALFAVGS